MHTPKHILVKIVPGVVIRDACGTWHGLCTVTSIHSIQKAQETARTDGHKTRKQVIQTTSRWQKIQGLKQREIELISKKVWRKRKEKLFRIRNWLLLHVKQYKNCSWRRYFIRKCIHTFCWSMITDHDEYVPTIINKQTSLNKPTSNSFTRST